MTSTALSARAEVFLEKALGFTEGVIEGLAIAFIAYPKVGPMLKKLAKQHVTILAIFGCIEYVGMPNLIDFSRWHNFTSWIEVV